MDPNSSLASGEPPCRDGAMAYFALAPSSFGRDALYTAGLPDPDLLIRTGGEQRISNFLVWQAAYAEFYFCPKLWPDFDADAFDDALVDYASRFRRFGR